MNKKEELLYLRNWCRAFIDFSVRIEDPCGISVNKQMLPLVELAYSTKKLGQLKSLKRDLSETALDLSEVNRTKMERLMANALPDGMIGLEYEVGNIVEKGRISSEDDFCILSSWLSSVEVTKDIEGLAESVNELLYKYEGKI